MKRDASEQSISSDDSYVFVSLPDEINNKIRGEENEDENERNRAATIHKSTRRDLDERGGNDSRSKLLGISVTETSSSNNYYNKRNGTSGLTMKPSNSALLESGRYFTGTAAASLVGAGKRRTNLCRSWKSLSRFQRSLLSGVGILFACSSVFILSTYYFTARLRPAGNEVEDARVEKYHGDGKELQRPSSRISDGSRLGLNETFKSAYKAGNQLIYFKGPQNDRQKAVVSAFKHAWNGYKKYAWGHDHLKPIARAHHDWFNLGLTIVDSLDTIVIMGLKTEFEEAKEWIAANLTFDVNKFVNLFETTIRVLGGLLSAYHMSGDRMFLEKARTLGDRLTGAFTSPSKIPFSDVNVMTRKAKSPSWGADSSLSEVTSIQLEFRDLSRQTGNPLYEQFAFNVSQHIHRIGCEKFEGLCPMFINPKTGRFQGGESITMGARADSYYEYLFKQWLQTGKTIDWLRDDYRNAMQAMIKHLVRQSEPNKLTFVGEILTDGSYSPKMDHLVCYVAGTLALGTVNGMPPEHMDLAKQLTHTCHEMYRNPSGMGPEIAHFNMLPGVAKQEDIIVKPLDAHSLLRPETIEAYFYLYRLTGDRRYQDWGWEAFEAIEKHAKIPTGGYSSVSNVKKVPVQYRDMQESFFLAETLKYLYLLFDDDQKNLLPLNEFVFNTEAHPLPVYER